MSSILDALEKLERVRPDGAPTGTSPAAPPPRRRRGPGLLAGGIAAAAAALAFAILRSPAPEGTTTPAAPPDVPIAPVAPNAHGTSTAGGAPAPPSPAPAAAQPSSQPDGARPVLAAAPPIPPPTDGDARPWGKTLEPAAAPVVRVPPVPPLSAVPRPSEPDPPPPVRRAPAGAPKVQLSFLLFSGSPDRRSVALSIDGSGLETLREGEASGQLEVVRILPDRVDLRWEGQPFTVRARD